MYRQQLSRRKDEKTEKIRCCLPELQPGELSDLYTGTVKDVTLLGGFLEQASFPGILAVVVCCSTT